MAIYIVLLYKHYEGSEKNLFSLFLETLFSSAAKKGLSFLECSYLKKSKYSYERNFT